MAINKRLIAGAPTGGGGACTTNTLQILGDSSCIAYYKMADASDESGSYNGTPTSVDFNVEGKYGLAGGFNGSSSNVEFSAGSFNDTTITISAWINSSSSAADQSIFNSFDYDGSASRGFIWRKNANQTLTAQFYNSGTQSNLNTTATVANNVWTNVVLTISTTQANIYINDGTPVTLTQNNLINFHPTTKAGIGSYRFTGGSFQQFFDGKIDQIRIFNKAISASEVGTLYAEVQCASAVTPSEHFNTVIWNGSSGTKAITVGFQPDFTWIKNRTPGGVGYSHQLYDSVRGVTKALFTNDTDVEYTRTQGLTSFDSSGTGGFTVGSRADTNSGTMVSWNWYAPTAETNNAGSNGATIASTIKKNVDAGFSIVKYTGTGATATIGHGLGSIVELLIVKGLETINDWSVLHKDGANGNFLQLNGPSGQSGSGSIFGSPTARPTDSVFTIGNTGETGTNNKDYIAYCFHSVEGYSRIGSYEGTGATGNSIVTGFEPAFVMLKVSTASDNWLIYDNKRGVDIALFANLNNAEDSYVGRMVFNSNGFTLNTTDAGWNGGSNTYIFMAFAQDPDTTPATKADSFEAKTYTGNGGTQNIVLSNGMKPDFVWIKAREANAGHALFDSIRGDHKLVQSNDIAVEYNADPHGLTSFDSNGFSVSDVAGGNNAVNGSAGGTFSGTPPNYISWNWKAADHDRSLSTINQDGSTTSLVSANQAAGFSIVKFSAAGGVATIGHGIDTPELILIKPIDANSNWQVYAEPIGNAKKLVLDLSDPEGSTTRFDSTDPTPSVFTFKDTGISGDFIAYCFHSVDGYQKIGSYAGDLTTPPSITTGFSPRFLMIKKIDNGTGPWVVIDSARASTNPASARLRANTSDAEYSNSAEAIYRSTTGFTVGTVGNLNTWDGMNANSTNYLYLAIA